MSKNRTNVKNVCLDEKDRIASNIRYEMMLDLLNCWKYTSNTYLEMLEEYKNEGIQLFIEYLDRFDFDKEYKEPQYLENIFDEVIAAIDES